MPFRISLFYLLQSLFLEHSEHFCPQGPIPDFLSLTIFLIARKIRNKTKRITIIVAIFDFIKESIISPDFCERCYRTRFIVL